MAIKNQSNTQFARTSVSGTRSKPASGDDEGIEPLADLSGRLWVNVVGFIPPTPDPFPNSYNYASAIAAPAVGVIAHAGNSRLDILSGYIRGTPGTPFWLHIFNRAILPVTTVTVPDVILPIQDAQLEFSKAQPKVMSLGIVIAPSSTEQIYTAFGAGITFMYELNYSTVT